MNDKIRTIAFVLFAALLLFGCVEAPKEKLSEMQMKLTYIGPQKKVVPTIGIAVKNFDLSKFENSGTKGMDYGNDKIFLNSFKVTEEEMKGIVNSTFQLEFIREGKISVDPVLSFMLYDATNNLVIERLLDKNQMRILVEEISKFLDKTNVDGLDTLKVHISIAEVSEKSTLTISLPVMFPEENNFTHWSVRIDGVNVTPKIPRSKFGQPVTVTGKNLSAGGHLLSFAFYYPDGWWTRYVWNFTIPSKLMEGGMFLDIGDIKIDAPRLLDPKAFPLGQGPPPVKVVMPDPEAPQHVPTEEPSKVKCEAHVKSITKDKNDSKGEPVVDIWRPDDVDWVEAQVCMKLAEGTQISTGYDSVITLDIVPVPPCEQKITTITSLTQVNVTAGLFNQSVWQTKLKLDTGTINVDVKKGELKTDLKVATPNTTAGISG